MKKGKVLKAFIIENFMAVFFFADCFNTEVVFYIKIPQRQSLINLQSLLHQRCCDMFLFFVFLVRLFQMMRLTFRIISRGKTRRTWDHFKIPHNKSLPLVQL